MPHVPHVPRASLGPGAFFACFFQDHAGSQDCVFSLWNEPETHVKLVWEPFALSISSGGACAQRHAVEGRGFTPPCGCDKHQDLKTACQFAVARD